MHGGGHETVHEHGARFLVQFVFDGVPVHGNFDDDIEIIGQVAPGGHTIQIHE
jgi:hypothetical protein